MADDPNAQTDALTATPAIEPAPEVQTSSLAPMRHAIFRDVWFSSLASNFGGLIQSVGASWMMASITTSAAMVALVQASNTLPVVLLALVGGAISDNFSNRGVMLISQGFMLVVSILLAIATLLGWMTPWLLLTFTFLIGCGSAVNGPAWQSSVGEMVPREDLPGAVALNSMNFNIARSVGPAIGGIIVAAAGAAAAFAVNAVSYVGLIWVLARWKAPVRPQLLPRESLWTAMHAGIRYVTMSPNIVSVLLRSSAFGFAATATLALMPLVARDLLHGGPLTYGLLLGAFGIGAVAGALSTARLRAMLSVEKLVQLSCGGFAICGGLSAVSDIMIVTMLGLVIGGACWVMALSTFNVTVQLSAPRWVVGRALALYQMFVFGGMALGSWVFGAIATHHGSAVALQVAALASLACGAIGMRWPLPQLAKLNLDPLARWQEPKIAVDIEPRSGPVVITIEYIIRDEDIVAFLHAMADRRRMRLRDGARHWTLMRDLADPELWMERYHSPTWVEYVRQAQRMTHADAVISDRVRALHSGEKPPRVHRMIERQTNAMPRHSLHPHGVGDQHHPTVPHH